MTHHIDYSEIMEKLFLFNFMNLPEQRRKKYILEIVEKNKKL